MISSFPGSSGTMYFGTEALIEDAFMVFALLLGLLVVVTLLHVTLNRAGVSTGWLWWLYGLVTTAMAGLVIGAFNDVRTRFTILAAAIYIIFAWGWLRRKMFGNFWRGLIFAVLIIAAVTLCWLL